MVVLHNFALECGSLRLEIHSVHWRSRLSVHFGLALESFSFHGSTSQARIQTLRNSRQRSDFILPVTSLFYFYLRLRLGFNGGIPLRSNNSLFGCLLRNVFPVDSDILHTCDRL